MDEFWRMKMGMPQLPNYHARRSTEDVSSCRRKPISEDSLNPEDFTDVFGGPPRTVLSRQFSTGACPRSSSSSSFLYEDIFRPADKAAQAVKRSGRSLLEFKIPGESGRSGDDRRNRENNSFYGDVFGCDNERIMRSRSRSKTSSSSVLSSEELSPFLPVVSGDGEDDVSSFASKLRPINVRSKWSSTRMEHEEQDKQKHTPVFAGKQPIYSNKNICIENLRNYPFGTSRRNTSPETISMEPISNGSTFGVSPHNLEVNSPSSPVSSIFQSDQDRKNGIEDEIMRQDDMEDDEVMSSYVIEINSDKEGISESNGVDEAIAWAKDQFQSYCSENSSKWGTPKYENEKPIGEMHNGRQLSEGDVHSFGSKDEQRDKWVAEEDSQQFETEVEIEMKILEEKIRLWSNGKGADIRFLLSSLHHILWPNSGWHAILITNIIERSQVKKAYQKARLCLHPDKLQQRGATVPQKYIAERAFSVLQDAWASFISEDH